MGNYVGASPYPQKGPVTEVLVWERDENGRKLVRYPAPYYFYVEDEAGTEKSMFGTSCRKVVCKDEDDFEQKYRSFHGTRVFESDIKPLDRVMLDNYYGQPAPPLNVLLWDIETDYKAELGFSRPANPYAPINSVSFYANWLDKFYVVAVPPPEWDGGDITSISMAEYDNSNVTAEVALVKTEAELLHIFMGFLEDSDVISGWNSDFFDLPYVMKRVEHTLGKSAFNRLSFIGAKAPRYKEVERFGKEELTGTIFGRNHLDYLALFKKFTFEGRTSWSIAAVAEDELDIPKLEHEETLEELYHQNFRKFIAYNLRDSELLKAFEDKFHFIQLANTMAHDTTSQMGDVLGTVRYVDLAIVGHAQHKLGLRVKNKEPSPHEKVEGAIVLTPHVGLHEWVGSVDINSLYPNVIRSLNISPEKLVGQFEDGEKAWRGIFDESQKLFTLRMEDGQELRAHAWEWSEILAEQKWAVTAYGTVFDQSSGKGVVPDILGYWYSERKRLQAEMRTWGKKEQELISSLGETISPEELAQVKERGQK